jgi:hypothetical protein
MFRWSKSGKSPAPAAGGGGEVAVQKVDRIEARNEEVSRPAQGGRDGEAFKRKADYFIRQMKTRFRSVSNRSMNRRQEEAIEEEREEPEAAEKRNEEELERRT